MSNSEPAVERPEYLWMFREIHGIDYVLVGDGSGINKEGGWAVLCLDLQTGENRLFVGSVSRTTVSVVELVGYLHVLGWLSHSGHDNARVLILSDSLYVCSCGNRTASRKANLHWWAALDELGERFRVTFCHIERNSTPELCAMDALSREARLQIARLRSEAEQKLSGTLNLSGEDHGQEESRVASRTTDISAAEAGVDQGAA